MKVLDKDVRVLSPGVWMFHFWCTGLKMMVCGCFPGCTGFYLALCL